MLKSKGVEVLGQKRLSSGAVVASLRDGEAKEECGGGGARAAGRFEGREGPGAEADGGPAKTERAESGGSAVVHGSEENREKFLKMRERSRILPP